MTQPTSATTPSLPPSPTPPDASKSSDAARRRGEKDNGSVKETIESILVAFILAFIFRAFVVEAFVIPTGSMAPTLLGAHMRFRCNDCGWRFDANYSPRQTAGDDLYIPSVSERSHKVFCPNCGYRIPEYDPQDPSNDAQKPDVYYGDRILVLKYLYLLEAPQRWDVVVFKSPDVRPPDDAGFGGETSPYQQNYIKRLVGRPGESILILNGDIYVGKPGQNVEQYEIQTKPRFVQEALWRVIYDNDFHPQRLKRDEQGNVWQQPWTVRDGSGWDLGSSAEKAPAGGRTFRFDNASGESTLFFDRDVNRITPRAGSNPEPYPFTDWLAYDVDVSPPMNVLHDLKLAFFYDRTAGTGPLRVKMTSGDEAFIAQITPDAATLVHVGKKGETPIGEPFKLAGVRGPVRIELSNVDHQVTLRINERDVARTTPQQYRPDVAALIKAFEQDRGSTPPTVEIAAGNQTAALSHIGLWRDIYYLNRSSGQELAWGVPQNLPERIIHLGEEEYFVLGDNSLISGDARYWKVPIELPADQLQVASGRVPGRFMLGRAFFVYWPAGFRPAPALPGIVPDFGNMRFIR